MSRLHKRSRRLLKKRLPAFIVSERSRDPSVELWAMDEHRVGLKPILRRVWARRGHRPTVKVRPRYKWLYVYGFVCPESGETEFWIAPSVNTETFRAIMGAFLRERGRAVVLVLDQAGWHVSGETRALTEEEPLSLVYLPSHSPELQPAERLWQLCDAPVVNKVFERIEDLEAALAEQCRRLTEQPEQIRRRTLYHWWPGGVDHSITL